MTDRQRAGRHRTLAVIVLTIVAWIGVTSTTPASGPVIEIVNPLEGTLFPRDMAPPVFRWQDDSARGGWSVRFEYAGAEPESWPPWRHVDQPQWQPAADEWERVKAGSLAAPTRFVVGRALPEGASALGPERPEAGVAEVGFMVSRDRVDAPIFFREVPLPLATANRMRPEIRWKLGDVASADPPRTVLEGVLTCANCHSFSRDGSTLAMDVDYGSDKGSYSIVDLQPETVIDARDRISWNGFRPEDGQRTLGLLSQISPDGRWVLSTVQETTVLIPLPDPNVPQLFFPVRGILAGYDRRDRRFFTLPGADDPDFVQTNPSFSPDGTAVVFARAPAVQGLRAPEPGQPLLPVEMSTAFVSGGRTLRYDLFRLPFAEGRGGQAVPVPGASANGKSNYFARFSPDGRWIVFCQANSFMLNQPDSALFIMPAAGGTPRRLISNAPAAMNSWHSWSPNSRWLVFSSKRNGPYTQLWLTHIDEQGMDSPPVVLERFTAADRAANLPEFVNQPPDFLQRIRLLWEPNLPPTQEAPTPSSD